MFSHIIGQTAVSRLSADADGGKLPPSVLFAGPSASGKGTAALALARRLSCETGGTDAACRCPSCVRHLQLSHPDLLCMGSRAFSAETAAAADAFSRALNREEGALDPADAAALFVRAVRKLLLRFVPALWEDEKNYGKFAGLAASLEEALEEIGAAGGDTAGAARAGAAAVKDAARLEAEGIGGSIPINQIRRAAAWAHLAPNGRRKLLLIENADRMQEGARNSLLKMLEEPPEHVSIVLTASRERALLQTILSRLRPYRFVRRPPDVEALVIRRVFGAPTGASIGGADGGITAYLDSFLPASDAALRPLAALFAASAAALAASSLKRQSRPLPAEIVALGTHAAPLAEAAGLGRHIRNPRLLIDTILSSAGNFESRGLFPRFLALTLDIVRESMPDGAVSPAYLDLWRSCASQAGIASASFNQKPAPALNRFLSDFRRGAADVF
jgi:DNA polymerase-3 subunit gamma/tau